MVEQRRWLIEYGVSSNYVHTIIGEVVGTFVGDFLERDAFFDTFFNDGDFFEGNIFDTFGIFGNFLSGDTFFDAFGAFERFLEGGAFFDPFAFFDPLSFLSLFVTTETFNELETSGPAHPMETSEPSLFILIGDDKSSLFGVSEETRKFPTFVILASLDSVSIDDATTVRLWEYAPALKKAVQYIHYQ